MALTEKQRRFGDEYLVDLVATKAAIRAGYSPASAYSQAHDLLKKPEMQAYLDVKRKELQEKTGITMERVLREYARIAFFDPRQLYTVDGALKQIRELDEDVAAVIAGLEVIEENISTAADALLSGTTKKVKFVDKTRALDSISRILGISIEKYEHTGKNGAPIQTETVIRIVRAKRDNSGTGSPATSPAAAKGRSKKV